MLQPVDVPAPVAAAGEVVIAVEFANVTFVETQLRGVGGDVGLAVGLLAPGGRFCPFGMASGAFAPVTPELARASGITVLRGAVPAAAELTALVADVLAEAAAGGVRPVIGQESRPVRPRRMRRSKAG